MAQQNQSQMSFTHLIEHKPAQLPLVTVRRALMEVAVLE